MNKEHQDAAQDDQNLPQTKRETFLMDSEDPEDEYKPSYYCKI